MQRDLVFDVGLHRGEDTEFYLKKGYRVVAFEANPDLVAECQARFSHAISAGALTIVEGAIAPPGTKGPVRFFKNTKVSVFGTIDSDRSNLNASFGAPSVEIDVPVVNFEEVFSKHGMPRFVKIDIEGADQFALQVIFSSSEKPPEISWESDKNDFNKVEMELQSAVQAGYVEFKVVQQKLIPGTTLTTRSLAGTPFDHCFSDGASGPFGEDLDGEWIGPDAALERYRQIYRTYQRWGDRSLARRLLTARVLNKLGEVIRHPLPGWYDTHARLPG
jgi:FkbM family methyltransferase